MLFKNSSVAVNVVLIVMSHCVLLSLLLEFLLEVISANIYWLFKEGVPSQWILTNCRKPLQGYAATLLLPYKLI